MIRGKGLASILFSLLVTTSPAVACRGWIYERTILLDAIPPVAKESEVIARVEILEVHVRELPGLGPLHVARARVLQPVRGTSDGQTVDIYAEPSSCGGGLNQSDVGRKGFIAGRFQPIADETFFSGSWANGQISKD